MSRKLVTIRRIDKLAPTKDADFIEQAFIGGWSVIVKKGEFQEGSLGYFFEIDSFLPYEDERFHFLGKPQKYKGKLGYRIKTIKMRSVLSQGLMLPFSMFPELGRSIDVDYSRELNVIKWERPISSNPTANVNSVSNKAFPSFIPKTDQERIENLTHYFNIFKGEDFEVTYKLNGSSMTCYKTEDISLWNHIKSILKMNLTYKFGVCSRNLDLDYSDDNLFWQAAVKYGIERKLPIGFAIQGELIGGSIQGNYERTPDGRLEYYIFDVYDITEQRYLTPEERIKFCYKYNLPHIKVKQKSIKIFEECRTIDELREYVKDTSIYGALSEGKVFKSTKNPTLHFKCIDPDFLLKGGD